MRKRLLGILVTSALLLSSAVCVFGDSKIAGAALTGDTADDYEISEMKDEILDEVREINPEAADLIEKINADEASLQEIADLQEDLREELEDKDLLTRIFDLTALDGAVKLPNGNYEVHLSVTNLTDAVTDVAVLHFSTVRNLWEIIEPTEVDRENKEITVEFEDLSPVAIIANTNGTKIDLDAGSTGESPKTGATSQWMLWIAGAVILAGSALVVTRRTRVR